MKLKIIIISIVVFLFTQSVVFAQEPCPGGMSIYSNGAGYEILPTPLDIDVETGDIFYVYGTALSRVRVTTESNGTFYLSNELSLSNSWSDGIVVSDDFTITRFYFTYPTAKMVQVCLISATTEPTATATATTEPTATATTEPTATATTGPTATPSNIPTAEPQTLAKIVSETIGIISIVGGISQLLTLMVLVFMAYYVVRRFLK